MKTNVLKYAALSMWVMGLCFAAGCADVDKKELSSEQPTSNVTTTEPSTGVVKGEFKKDAAGDQRMVASSSATANEVYLDVPPGALAIDTSITMQDGSNANPNTLPADLGMADTAILGGSPPVLLSAEGITDTAQPFTLNIPIPVEEPAGSGLHLNTGTGKVAILYLVKTSSGNKVGLFVLGKDDLIGTIVRYKGARFGWFRIVLLSSAVSTVEKDTAEEPAAVTRS